MKHSRSSGNENLKTIHAIKNHAHTHGENCGHKAVKHGDHMDYQHEGHIHRVHKGHTVECDGSDKSLVTVVGFKVEETI